MDLRISTFLPQTTAEGPGVRACLWVQGCPIRCPGCAVPWTWAEKAGTVVTVEDLTRQILALSGIEGVTFVGGEPFAQAAALAVLGRNVQAAGLSVVTFTGYTFERIQTARYPEWDALLAVTDLLIDGPYLQDQPERRRPWIGSANQRYRFLTNRYRLLEPLLETMPNRLEIRIHPDGRVFMNGMADKGEMQGLIGRG